MTWPPAAAKLVVNVAVPPTPTATVPRTTLPSWNVTVPVGVPAPGATAATVAVKVTAWPVTAGLTDDRRATADSAGLTITFANPALSAKPGPAKEAGRQWSPTPGDPTGGAGPAPSPGGGPSRVVPPGRGTVRVAPPPADVTVALSVTGCPKMAVAVDGLSDVDVFAPCPSP